MQRLANPETRFLMTKNRILPFSTTLLLFTWMESVILYLYLPHFNDFFFLPPPKLVLPWPWPHNLQPFLELQLFGSCSPTSVSRTCKHVWQPLKPGAIDRLSLFNVSLPSQYFQSMSVSNAIASGSQEEGPNPSFYGQQHFLHIWNNFLFLFLNSMSWI